MSSPALRGLRSWACGLKGRAKSKWPGMAMAAVLALVPGGAAWAADDRIPSTFSTTIGPGLLCRDQINPHFYWTYMSDFFGKPYKNEGGAYWFRVKATLWGVAISDVLVSDGTNPVVFLAAVAQVKPDALSKAIMDVDGIRYTPDDKSKFSVLQSNYGSKIVYFGEESKIYCSMHNMDYDRGTN